MKTEENKSIKGISLIVLVITIIVIIILATMVIVTLLSNNPMSEANKARFESDRDNMQSVFTNTVAKVMAQKQVTMNIKASALNTVTSGVSTATGDANYTLNGVADEENANGRIIFDNKENTETEYYTGKQLPIYKAGETTWYVDEEGIISLKVGDKIYGEGKIVNGIKITAKVIESEEFVKNKAKVRIEVAYENQLQNIIFNNETITEFEKQENVYIIEREVTKNGTYEIVANGENGATSKASIEVNQIENLNSDIQINGTVTLNEDFSKGTLGIEIIYNGEVESIKINGGSVAVPSKNGGKYTINKEITANGEYKVEVKAKDGTINKIVINVDELADNMEIWNRADMEKFRDKVNKGATYAGKTVTVMDDIDLGGINWTPIANAEIDESLTFKGTFEGNYHKIKNLYINSSYGARGLFGVNEGNIYRIQIESGRITGGSITGAIVGANYLNISECGNNISISGTNNVGGIAGQNFGGKIRYCYNKGAITSSGDFNVGGIVGASLFGGIIEYSYNTGSVTSNGDGSGGIAGTTYSDANAKVKTRVSYSYNIGYVSGRLRTGAIVGANGSNAQRVGGAVTYCYFLDESCGAGIGASVSPGKETVYSRTDEQMKAYTLSDILVKDTVNKNNGYPILKWELEH